MPSGPTIPTSRARSRLIEHLPELQRNLLQSGTQLLIILAGRAASRLFATESEAGTSHSPVASRRANEKASKRYEESARYTPAVES